MTIQMTALRNRVLTGLAFLIIAIMATPEALAIPGDLNGDNQVNALDLRLLQMARLGLRVPLAASADLDADGRIDASDFNRLAQGVIGRPVLFGLVPNQEAEPGELTTVTGLNLDGIEITRSLNLAGDAVDPTTVSVQREMTMTGQSIATQLTFRVPATAKDGLLVGNFGLMSTSTTLRVVTSSSISASSVNEGEQFNLLVTLSAPSIDDIHVQLGINGGEAVAGQDYQLLPLNTVIPAGLTSQIIALNTIDDGDLENNESIHISITSMQRAIAGQLSSIATNFNSTEIRPEIIDNDSEPSKDLDLNGDGVVDLVVAEQFYSGETGRVIVQLRDNTTGSIDSDSLNGTNGFTIHATQNLEGLGKVVDHGDINRDGITDLVIASFERIYVIYGSTTPIQSATFDLNSLDGTNGFILESKGSRFDPLLIIGGQMAVGDVNGDKFADIIFSGNSRNSAIAVFFGRQSVTNTSGFNNGRIDIDQHADLAVLQRTPPFIESFVRSIKARDLTGDGHANVIISESFTETQPFQTRQETRVILGLINPAQTIDLDNLSPAQSFLAIGESYPFTETQVGDINGDSVPDLVIADAANGISVIFGPISRFTQSFMLSSLQTGTSSDGFVIQSPNQFAIFGFSTDIGDLNNDGIDDIITASVEDGSPILARAYFGRTQFSGSILSADPGTNGFILTEPDGASLDFSVVINTLRSQGPKRVTLIIRSNDTRAAFSIPATAIPTNGAPVDIGNINAREVQALILSEPQNASGGRLLGN